MTNFLWYILSEKCGVQTQFCSYDHDDCDYKSAIALLDKCATEYYSTNK